MPNSTVRISRAASRLLGELAQHTGQTKTDLLSSALECYRRKVFFEQLNAGYAKLRANPTAWAEEMEERRQMDAANLDGLNPGEHWSETSRRPVRKKK